MTPNTPPQPPIVLTSPLYGTVVVIFDERGQRVYYVEAKCAALRAARGDGK